MADGLEEFELARCRGESRSKGRVVVDGDYREKLWIRFDRGSRFEFMKRLMG